MDEDTTTYLGKYGYTIIKEYLPQKELQLIRKELNVAPYVPKTSLNKPTPFRVYKESKTKLYIPRFYGIENYGIPDKDLLSNGDKTNIKFNGSLRDYQKPIVKAFLDNAKINGSGLLEIYAGAGKTCMGLYIAAALGVKTLIVVHKEFLLRQWIERIEQFLPDAKVGRLQRDIIDIEGKDIVIGMLQSLSMKKYDKNIFQTFGFTIYDEVHHVSAEVFSRALLKIVTRYSLGLSATMNRKDGLTKVIKMFLGEVAYKLERQNTHNVVVKAIKYINNNEAFAKTELNFRGHTHYSLMIKKICEYNHRSEFILELLKHMLKTTKNPDMQVIILGHNKSLLTYLFDAISHRKISTVGYYIGGMKEEQLKESETKKVIIATYAMAEEGLDIKTLTTLIMATPKVDVTQAVGRILRKKSSNAEVYDIVDQHDIFKRHFSKRKTYYKKNKFKVIMSTNNEYKIETNWELLLKDGKKCKSTKKGKSHTIKVETNPFLQGKCLL